MIPTRTRINQLSHRLGVLAALAAKAELQARVEALKRAGATADTIGAYLARCEAAGRVLEPVEKD